ncbi:hypothetical protein RRF68_00210 [Tenacibaculum sp. HL-MS23]|uniref:hypothetical protein n=1 Tax=Tenacibaculum sp. HL-MS23 TaxID=3077734 RepID=UPI0028FC3374|nr:hypothetical protein [Tenacibaculum sp. HL-MS23]WNW01868.1 hypothetical protein RRF68_00210 [Tenacibaculum sp. HL-MS23]
MSKIAIGQDGSSVNKSAKNKFGLIQGLDTRFKHKRLDSEVYDFVGLVCQQEQTLVVFPKHYYSEETLTGLLNDDTYVLSDIILLFEVIQKYLTNQNPKALKYAGNRLEFESEFPFASFFSIYTYFQQFGIYTERITKTKIGYKGKISWKDTIRKSAKIYSGQNLLHFPYYIKENKSKQVFISDCMAFAIDYTLNRFSFLFSIPKTNHKKSTFDFFENSEYVVKHLQAMKNEVFKDVNRKLIYDLIEFYSDLAEHRRGGDIHIKIKYFNLVWEDMVGHYLNNHFVNVDDENKMLFDISNFNSKVTFSKKSFNVDKSNNQYKIEPDHYFIDSEHQYIFDAKYFDSLASLNYKQYSYHEMLKNKIEDNKTISALLLPSEYDNSTEIHFILSDEYKQEEAQSTTIISQRLRTREVMTTYLKSRLKI